MISITDILKERAKTIPNRVIYNFLDYSDDACTEHEVTVEMLFQHAQSIARELQAKGAKKGDRVVIFSMQDAGTIYAVYGAIMAGTMFTLIPPPIDESKAQRFISVVKSCKPRFVISNYGLEKTQEAGVDVKKKLLKQAFLQTLKMKRIFTDRIKQRTSEIQLHSPCPNDIIYLQYTSGSTSTPKGVMVSSKNLMTNINQCLNVFDFSTGNNLAMWIPFFHNLGLLIGIFLPIVAIEGVTYFLSTLQFLQKPTLWLKVLSDYKIKNTAGPNSAYAIFNHILSKQSASEYNLSQVAHFINGSEFVDPVTITNFCKLFDVQPNAFAPGYGLAENVCMATVASRNLQTVWVDKEFLKRNRFVPSNNKEGKELVSLGKPTKGLLMVAVNPETRKQCNEDEIGEIHIQGDSVCKGYWGNIKDNDSFNATIQGYDGYFYKTGDLGIIYKGNFYMTGRIKELIVINGHNIYPADIKALLQKHVTSIAIDTISIFNIERNEKEAVVICLETNNRHTDYKTECELINKAVAHHFEFSFYDVVFVKNNSLPRTDNRKIQTHKIKELYPDKIQNVVFSSRNYKSDEPSPREKKETTIDAIHATVKSIFDTLLENDNYNLNTSFLELGGDSLKLVECACELEELFHINLDITELSFNPSVNGISEYIEHKIVNGNDKQKQIDLNTECYLDENIVPENKYSHTIDACKKLFLTGSTGFLGAYLIRSLIEQNHKKEIIIYCHVRAENEEEALLRIKNNMMHFKCWKNEYTKHIVAVTGSLDMPDLGIKKAVYEQLCAEIDAIYHNGALLNFLYPYGYLKKTNVDGTRECLRFACKGKAKYFHYVSSYSVYDNPSHFRKTVYENDPLTSPEGYLLGYSETKWVSEKLIQIAQKRGLSTCIYRPGDITGDPEYGIWEMKDIISRLVAGCITMQKAPKIRTNVNLVPVGFVSDAIAHIAQQPGAAGLAFNILNPKKLILREIIKGIKRKGYPIKLVSFKQWRNELLKSGVSENPLRILASLFVLDENDERSIVRRYSDLQPRYDLTNMQTFLKDSNITCQETNTQTISKYLNYFETQGYIKR